MIDNLYKAFVDATHNVFNLMLDLTDIHDRPANEFTCDDEIDIAIPVVGDLSGEVVYRFPVTTSLNMVNIMSGMQVEEVDAFVTSAISEIANIISGNVLMTLSENALTCDILPPVQRRAGEGQEDKEYSLQTSCCINSSIGLVCLEIKLNRA